MTCSTTITNSFKLNSTMHGSKSSWKQMHLIHFLPPILMLQTITYQRPIHSTNSTSSVQFIFTVLDCSSGLLSDQRHLM